MWVVQTRVNQAFGRLDWHQAQTNNDEFSVSSAICDINAGIWHQTGLIRVVNAKRIMAQTLVNSGFYPPTLFRTLTDICFAEGLQSAFV